MRNRQASASVRVTWLALLLAALALLSPAAAFAQEFPELTGRVTDAASISNHSASW
jgi:hypothetical protein